jgi:hypothetical protein
MTQCSRHDELDPEQFLDWSLLDLFGMGGYVCQPSLSNAVKSKGIVLFHKASERILHLDDGLEGSASNVISLTQIKCITLNPLDFVWDAFDQRWEGMFAKLENYR